MQDKEVQRYMDPEFRDKAWQEMQSILDREMPVQKDKRRFIIWFWRAAGIVLLITAAVIFWPETPSQHEIASTESEQLLFENNPVEKNISDENTSIVIAKNTTAKNQIQKTEPKADNSPKSRNQNADVITAKLPPVKEAALAQNPNPNDLSPSSPKTEGNETIITATLPTDEIIPNSLPGSVDMVHTVRTLDFEVSGYSGDDFSFDDNTMKVSRKYRPSKVDFLIYGNGQSESFLALTGYEAGVAIHKRLRKSKWGLSIGAGFQSEIRTLDFETESYLNLATDDASLPDFQVSVNPEIGNSYGFTDNTDAPVNNPSLTDYEFLAAANAASSRLNVKLNYLAFPVSVSYPLTPRIGILAGVTPSIYLSGAVTIQDNYAELDRNLTYDELSPLASGGNNSSTDLSKESHPLQNNRYFYYTSKPLAPAAIKRMKFPIHLGFNYQLTRYFGLSLDYQFTPHNITDKPYIQTPQQRVRLGGYLKF